VRAPRASCTVWCLTSPSTSRGGGFAVLGINAADLLTPALGAALLGTYTVVAVAAGAC